MPVYIIPGSAQGAESDLPFSKFGSQAVNADDLTGRITFATPFAATPTNVQAWLTNSDGFIVDCVITEWDTSGISVTYGAPLVGDNFVLQWRALS